MGSPSPPPTDFWISLSSVRRPQLSDVLTLAANNGLHRTDDETVLLAHRPPNPHSASDTPPSAVTPPRVYVPMLMRLCVLHACHATASCHLGVHERHACSGICFGGLA